MLHKPTAAEGFRETRDFACESKFLLSAAQADSIRHWARLYLQMDPHGGGDHGDAYQVSSVYYDTTEFAVFQRRGSFGRSKYRIRRYADREQVFLERKTKTETQMSKRRSQVPLEDLRQLALTPQPDWSGYWFQRRLRARQLSPVCRISYQRVARVGQTETGPCRLTLDHDVHAAACSEALFSNGSPAESPASRPLLREKPYILELKYRYALPMLFRQLLVEFAPLPQRLSKYRLAVATLGLAESEVLERPCEAS